MLFSKFMVVTLVPVNKCSGAAHYVLSFSMNGECGRSTYHNHWFGKSGSGQIFLHRENRLKSIVAFLSSDFKVFITQVTVIRMQAHGKNSIHRLTFFEKCFC